MTEHHFNDDGGGKDVPQRARAGDDDNEMTTTSRQRPARRRVKVVIVGAGASGLQCAKELVDHYDMHVNELLILEARNRVGGRIHSTRERRRRRAVPGKAAENNSNNDDKKEEEEEVVEFVLDHGAAWVHGTGYDWGEDPKTATSVPTINPMMKLLQQTTPNDCSVYEHHLRHIALGNPWTRPHSVLHATDGIALYVAGQKLANDDPRIHAALRYHFTVMKAVGQYGKRMFENGEGMNLVTSSLQEGIEMIQQENTLLSQTQQLLESGLDQKEVQVISRFYIHLLECWYGAPATNLQLCEFDTFDDDEEAPTAINSEKLDSNGNTVLFCDAEYHEKGDFYGPHCTLRHGMEVVLEPLLLGGVGDRVELEQEVTQIRWNQSESSVSVDTAQGLCIEADCCVVTIPAGCLKKAVKDKNFFSPGLSAEKVEAIGYLKIGHYKKVFLTFDHICWPDQLPAFLGMIRSVESDLPGIGNFLIFDNLWARQGIPCIEAVLFGSAGEWSLDRSVEEIREAVLDFMIDAMSLDADIKDACVDCHVTRWEEDPYSQGSYSYMGLGALIRHVEE